MKEENKDIRSLSALLTQENKQYVIAVANALLFSQKREETAASKSVWGDNASYCYKEKGAE